MRTDVAQQLGEGVGIAGVEGCGAVRIGRFPAKTRPFEGERFGIAERHEVPLPRGAVAIGGRSGGTAWQRSDEQQERGTTRHPRTAPDRQRTMIPPG